MQKVPARLAQKYEMTVDAVLRGKRGKDYESRKAGMNLVKEWCDLKLQEIAQKFGTGSYGAVV